MGNRELFQNILTKHRLTQADSAALICELTQRPCSVRAVRSWLNDPDKPSSRSCPDWAITALSDALKRRDHEQDRT